MAMKKKASCFTKNWGLRVWASLLTPKCLTLPVNAEADFCEQVWQFTC